MRVAIAAYMHESNTFIATPTTLADYEIKRGPEIIETYQNTFHEVGGFIAGADEVGYDMIPLLAANATPSGPLTAETVMITSMVALMVITLRAMQVKIICKAMMGATNSVVFVAR